MICRQCGWVVGALLTSLLLAGCRETLLHDLDESQANRVLVALARAGVEAEKSRDGAAWSVSVEQSGAMRALEVIQESRIIRRDEKVLQERSGSLLPAKEERDFFRERQTSLALEETLERLPGVLEARVHLLLHSDGVSSSRITSASVLLVADGSKLDEAKVREIVGGASGVERSKISLVLSEQKPERRIIEAPRVREAIAPGALLFAGASILGLSSLLLFVRRKAREREARPIIREPLQRVF